MKRINPVRLTGAAAVAAILWGSMAMASLVPNAGGSAMRASAVRSYPAGVSVAMGPMGGGGGMMGGGSGMMGGGGMMGGSGMGQMRGNMTGGTTINQGHRNNSNANRNNRHNKPGPPIRSNYRGPGSSGGGGMGGRGGMGGGGMGTQGRP